MGSIRSHQILQGIRCMLPSTCCCLWGPVLVCVAFEESGHLVEQTRFKARVCSYRSSSNSELLTVQQARGQHVRQNSISGRPAWPGAYQRVRRGSSPSFVMITSFVSARCALHCCAHAASGLSPGCHSMPGYCTQEPLDNRSKMTTPNSG